MYQKYALYFSVFITLSSSFNATINDTTNETGNITFTTKTFTPTTIPLPVEDATCRREENTSVTVQEKQNKTYFDMLTEEVELRKSTTEEVNGTVLVTLETNNKATDLNLIENNITDCSKTPIKRENLPMSMGPSKIFSNKDLCPMYKNGVEVSLTELMGDWRTVFYKASQVISCFRIHIKKISFEEKLNNKERYGTFNRSVDWHKCHLEISGSRIKGKHFLQGGLGDEGVLRNIIIVKGKEGCAKLQEEAPDQWRALNDLLILRACDNGDVIVFTRFGKRPNQDEIKDAMEVFGETRFDGLPTCQDTKPSPSKNRTNEEDSKGDIPKADLIDSRSQDEDDSRNTVPMYDQFFK